MGWLFLFLAGLCEMVWPLGFKYTDGFRAHYWAAGVTGLVMVTSFALMSQATNRGIPIGHGLRRLDGPGARPAPSCWAWPCSTSHTMPGGLACLTLIILGVVGLKLHERPPAPDWRPPPPAGYKRPHEGETRSHHHRRTGLARGRPGGPGGRPDHDGVA